MCPLGGLLKAFTRRVAEKAPLGEGVSKRLAHPLFNQ